MSIFNETQRRCLDLAEKLYEKGDAENSRILCENCVREAAVSSYGDVLEFFYGANAYLGISSVASAIERMVIAACLKKLLDAVSMKGPATDSMTRWASPAAVSNANVKEFFAWLSLNSRMPNLTDRKYIRALYININRVGIAPMNYEMSDRIANMPLIDIIRGVLSGKVKVNSKGGLS